MKAELTLLIQSTVDKRNNTSSNTKKVECFKCGGDHYANVCPENKSGSGSSKIKKKRQKSGGGGNQTNPDTKWKRTPPKKDEAHTKEVSGTKYFWCGTCKIWNTTHGTTDHVAGFKKTGGGGGGSSNGSTTTGTGQANLAQTGLVAGFLANVSSKGRAGQSN
jgi:hypothetical protein